MDNCVFHIQQPQQLVEMIMSSIIERSNKLFHLISVVRAALFEIVNITSPGAMKLPSIELSSFQPLPLKLVESSRSSTINPDYSNKSTPQRSGHASGLQSTLHTSSAGTMVMSFSPTHDSLGQLGPAVEGVLIHFCEETFDVVNKMVLASHDLFSSTLWNRSSQQTRSAVFEEDKGDEGEEGEEGEGKDKERRNSRMVSFNVPDSPEKVDSLAEVPRHAVEGEIQSKIGNLASLQNK